MGSNKIPWILFEFEKKPRGFFSRQLGLGNTDNYDMPMELFLENILFISCGRFHSVALVSSTENQIYVWGCNRYGSRIKSPGFYSSSRKNPEGFSRDN